MSADTFSALQKQRIFGKKDSLKNKEPIMEMWGSNSSNK